MPTTPVTAIPGSTGRPSSRPAASAAPQISDRVILKPLYDRSGQRAVNLSLGAALSTIGLTVPVVLAISVYTGTPLRLGLDQAEIVLLALTLIVAHMTFSGVPTNILFGFIHIVLFLTYIVLVFQP